MLARHGERARKLAPAAVGILYGDEPVGGATHVRAVLLTQLANAAGESKENLPGIENSRDEGDRADRARLKAPVRKLNRHEPIEHRPRARTKLIIAAIRRAAQHRRDDIPCRLWI
jgi:hypothetical protein